MQTYPKTKSGSTKNIESYYYQNYYHQINGDECEEKWQNGVMKKEKDQTFKREEIYFKINTCNMHTQQFAQKIQKLIDYHKILQKQQEKQQQNDKNKQNNFQFHIKIYEYIMDSEGIFYIFAQKNPVYRQDLQQYLFNKFYKFSPLPIQQIELTSMSIVFYMTECLIESEQQLKFYIDNFELSNIFINDQNQRIILGIPRYNCQQAQNGLISNEQLPTFKIDKNDLNPFKYNPTDQDEVIIKQKEVIYILGKLLDFCLHYQQNILIKQNKAQVQTNSYKLKFSDDMIRLREKICVPVSEITIDLKSLNKQIRQKLNIGDNTLIKNRKDQLDTKTVTKKIQIPYQIDNSPQENTSNHSSKRQQISKSKNQQMPANSSNCLANYSQKSNRNNSNQSFIPITSIQIQVQCPVHPEQTAMYFNIENKIIYCDNCINRFKQMQISPTSSPQLQSYQFQFQINHKILQRLSDQIVTLKQANKEFIDQQKADHIKHFQSFKESAKNMVSSHIAIEKQRLKQQKYMLSNQIRSLKLKDQISTQMTFRKMVQDPEGNFVKEITNEVQQRKNQQQRLLGQEIFQLLWKKAGQDWLGVDDDQSQSQISTSENDIFRKSFELTRIDSLSSQQQYEEEKFQN